jgi:hypothetical protein
MRDPGAPTLQAKADSAMVFETTLIVVTVNGLTPGDSLVAEYAAVAVDVQSERRVLMQWKSHAGSTARRWGWLLALVSFVGGSGAAFAQAEEQELVTAAEQTLSGTPRVS